MVIHIINSIIQSEEFDEIIIVYNPLYKKKHFKIIKNYIENLKNNDLKLKFILQKEILGTAHAVKIALESKFDNIKSEERILVFLGDAPLITTENIKNTMKILSMKEVNCLVNFYDSKKLNKHGKPIFDENNNLKEVVEYKEYINNEEIKNLTLCCGGIFAAKKFVLMRLIDKMYKNDFFGEYSLFGLIKVGYSMGILFDYLWVKEHEAIGTDDKESLKEARRIFNLIKKI